MTGNKTSTLDFPWLDPGYARRRYMALLRAYTERFWKGGQK